MKKEREEKERKAKEEREARLAKEREERAERERIEKEKREERERIEKEKRLAKEKEEKAEKEAKEAKEKAIAQQRAAALAQAQAQAQANAVKPPPIRPNATASSSSNTAVPVISKVNVTPVAIPVTPRSPNSVTTNGTAPKKVINNSKHIPAPALPNPPPGVGGQGNRPHHPPQQLQQPPQQMQSQPNMPRPHHPPLTPIGAQHLPSHLPPPPQSSMMFNHPQGPVMIPPPALSPRVGAFPSMQFPYGGPNMQHHSPGTPLAPPRGFNGPAFDPNFNRGMNMGIGIPIGNIPAATPSPIGPPKAKAPLPSTSAPGPSMLAPGQGRRPSILSAESSGPGPGPITRPAPIARPTASNVGETASNGSSPSRRSPSPKGILGSSALAADDDEVVSRRVGNTAPIGIGIGMGGVGGSLPNNPIWNAASPRAPIAPIATPWGGFSPSQARPIPTSIGSNNHLPTFQSPVPPIGGGSMWTNSPATNGDNWHPQGNGFFPPGGYMNPNAAASAPHAGS